MREVSAMRDAVASQASSQPVPHGVSSASNPSSSHARATCARYAWLGARLIELSSGNTSRESPPVGKNQFISIMGIFLTS